jgi:nitrate reductase gamma subunit
MSLRRWLISEYDFTGLGKYFYRSWKAELAAVLLAFVCTAAGLVVYGSSVGSIHVYDGPGAFLPSAAIHTFDFLLAFALVVFLGLNAGRMWWLTMIKDRKKRAPLSLYLRRIYHLPLHFFSQMRYAKCGDTGSWFIHFCVVFGYVTMLVLIMGFLGTMQAGPEIQWSVHAFGYAASAALLVATLMMVRARLVRSGPQGHHTHTTDWMFLLLLVVLVVTGILQHAVHRLGYATAANVAYVVHLSIVVTWFSRYPFTKWSHIIYRPLAMYFAEVRREVSGPHAMQSAAPVAGAQLQGQAA